METNETAGSRHASTQGSETAQGSTTLISKRPPCRSLTGVRIAATGGYVPDGVVTNEQLCQHFNCDTDWIVRRTGILERRHALPHQATSDLCYEAAMECLARAEAVGHSRHEVDMILVATYTPDNSFPCTACMLQERLGLLCGAMDINVGCTGFVYALITGAAYIVSGAVRKVLVIGGDVNSRSANPNDPKTYPLFGDGGGAVLLVPGDNEHGFLSFMLGADGAGGDLLIRPGCGSRLPPDPDLLAQGLHYLHMDGRNVFRWAVNILCESIRDVLDHAKLKLEDIHLFIPHQANIRIIHAATDVLGINRERVCTNVRWYGNTSAASIPLALHDAVKSGLVQPDKLYVLCGFGAGLAWGTTVLRW
jgi:3-oxoacyl-[acyl-carrier-protein] synthase-3